MRKELEKKKKKKKIKDQGKEQVYGLKSLKSSNKQLPSIRDFISKEKLNPGIINELERAEEEEKESDRSKIVYEIYNNINLWF